jgi:hypothetical protein
LNVWLKYPENIVFFFPNVARDCTLVKVYIKSGCVL